jgi:[ribosomal protein S5]-alanine N-acetyltransferase
MSTPTTEGAGHPPAMTVASVNVSIEPLLVDHFRLVAEWLSKPDVNKWLTSEWRNRTVEPQVIAVVVRNRRNRLFLVRCNAEPCGMVALSDIDVIDGTAMVWYLLGEPSFAGRGVTSEAVRLIARESFQTVGLRSLYAWAMADNVASLRVLQKAGFRHAGLIRESAVSNGAPVSRIYFDRTVSD